jgi:hypothetical protein
MPRSERLGGGVIVEIIPPLCERGTAVAASGVQDSTSAAAAGTPFTIFTPKAAPTAPSGVRDSASGEVGSPVRAIVATIPKAAPIAPRGVQDSASGEVGSPLMNVIAAPTMEPATTASSGVQRSASDAVASPWMRRPNFTPAPETAPTEHSGVQHSAGELGSSTAPVTAESTTPGSPSGTGKSKRVVIAPELATEILEPMAASCSPAAAPTPMMTQDEVTLMIQYDGLLACPSPRRRQQESTLVGSMTSNGRTMGALLLVARSSPSSSLGTSNGKLHQKPKRSGSGPR